MKRRVPIGDVSLIRRDDILTNDQKAFLDFEGAHSRKVILINSRDLSVEDIHRGNILDYKKSNLLML
jgi:hypothetical protein